MNKAFDISVDALSSPQPAPKPQVHARHSYAKPRVEDYSSQGAPPTGKSFFIETFGCQMNDHDSEKVAGVLMARGYYQVETPAQADLVLYNTCSIREKAAQKVSRGWANWKNAANGKIIGVLGCVAQQEGEKIFERARGSVWCAVRRATANAAGS